MGVILARVDVPANKGSFSLALMLDEYGMILRVVDTDRRCFLIPRYPVSQEDLRRLLLPVSGRGINRAVLRSPKYTPDVEMEVDHLLWTLTHGENKIAGYSSELRLALETFLEECERCKA